MLPPSVIALSPGTLDEGAIDGFERAAGKAVEGGLRGLLLREPSLSDESFLALARRLRALLDEPRGAAGAGAWLGIHDRAHLAVAARADGVHLGFRSLGPAALSPWLADRCSIGLSTHAGDDPAGWRSADYLFHGPVRATPSKEGLLAPVGLDGLSAAVEAAGPVPVWGIGGLLPRDLRQVQGAGARGAAAVRSILGCPDPGAAAREWCAEAAAEREGGR